MDSNKRLYKCEDGMVFGVCKGIAEYFNIDPTLVRLLWAILLCCAGTGFLLYLILAIILPPKSEVEKEMKTHNAKSKEKK